jgi:hypothetical protein
MNVVTTTTLESVWKSRLEIHREKVLRGLAAISADGGPSKTCIINDRESIGLLPPLRSDRRRNPSSPANESAHSRRRLPLNDLQLKNCPCNICLVLNTSDYFHINTLQDGVLAKDLCYHERDWAMFVLFFCRKHSSLTTTAPSSIYGKKTRIQCSDAVSLVCATDELH